MTWVAWRQFRAQAVVAALALLAVVAVLAATRPHIAAVIHLHGLDALSHSYDQLRLIGTGLIGVPALIGAFWGAPLVPRELEAGTQRLAWTQSITRGHWLLVKVAVITGAAALVVGVFSLAFTWWSAPADGPWPRLGTAEFGQRGIAPVGYVVFAVVLGVFLGILLRRTLAAMAATLVGFTVVRFAVQALVRPHLLSATSVAAPTTMYPTSGGPSALTSAWVLSRRTVDAAGHPISSSAVDHAVGATCHATRSTSGRALSRCASHLGVHDVVRMIPGSRFWALQSAEVGVFLALAAVLLVASLRLIRHRTA